MKIDIRLVLETAIRQFTIFMLLAGVLAGILLALHSFYERTAQKNTIAVIGFAGFKIYFS